MIGLGDVRAAARRLQGVTHRTPVLSSRTLDELVGARVLIKAETFQRGGAFKLRGAFNKISSIPEADRDRGVIAFSSGNHAQGVALASAALGVCATILMPADTPVAKLAATRGYGADVITYDRFREDRELIGRRLAQTRGLTLVHPFDDELVMAGQGTAALELVEEVGELDLMLVPVGGGGLLAGTATVVRALLPQARVFGVEPELGDDHVRSFAAGQRVRIPVPRTIADALTAPMPGELTFTINRERAHGVVTVTDAQLVDAMRFAFERLKLVVEPSGTAALAAVMSGQVSYEPGARIGLILTGGNVDRGLFGELLAG
jgi:threo-3-hydroxy-L-aspartate ammonia-lyase